MRRHAWQEAFPGWLAELGKEAIIDLKPMQPGDVRESFADIKYTYGKIGFKPKTNIQIGIPLFLSWYNNFYR